MNDLATASSRRADAAALLFALLFPTLVTWVYFVLLAESGTAIIWTACGVGKVVQFSFPLVWVLAMQHRRLGVRLPDGRGLAEGIGFGLFVLVVMLVLYHVWLYPAGYMDAAVAAVRQKLDEIGVRGPRAPLKYLALGVFYSLFHSLLEEYYWRWFVFGQLRRLVPLWPAVAVSSLGFMAHHVLLLGRYFGGFSPMTVLFSLAVAVGGAAWAWVYHRSDSLWGPWLSHLCVDAGIFVIGYQMAFGS
jgi:membrane protease YdiL (CAAX protease family)